MKPAEYDRMYQAEERQWWYAGMRAISSAILVRELGSAVRVRVLDAGCGTGHNLTWLGRFGCAFGIDLAERATELSNRRGVAVVRGDLARLPFSDETFDVVTSFDVLYHQWVVDDAAAVRELVRTVRPGGLLLVRVPALQWLWGAHDQEVLSRHRYTRRELAGLLSLCGLCDVRATYVNALLFPVVALRRAFDRWSGREGSDVQFLPAPLEWLFRRALSAESWWLRHSRLPIGSSVMAWGRRAH